MSDKVQPSKYYLEEGWRKLQPWDEKRADRIRYMLISQMVHPTKPREQDPLFADEEELGRLVNYRYALEKIIGELGHAELEALFRVGRLLLLCEFSQEQQEYWACRHQKTLARLGLSGD